MKTWTQPVATLTLVGSLSRGPSIPPPPPDIPAEIRTRALVVVADQGREVGRLDWKEGQTKLLLKPTGRSEMPLFAGSAHTFLTMEAQRTSVVLENNSGAMNLMLTSKLEGQTESTTGPFNVMAGLVQLRAFNPVSGGRFSVKMDTGVHAGGVGQGSRADILLSDPGDAWLAGIGPTGVYRQSGPRRKPDE